MVYALTGMLQVGASLFFVFVCKHLIDIATGVSGDNLAIYRMDGGLSGTAAGIVCCP